MTKVGTTTGRERFKQGRSSCDARRGGRPKPVAPRGPAASPGSRGYRYFPLGARSAAFPGGLRPGRAPGSRAVHLEAGKLTLFAGLQSSECH